MEELTCTKFPISTEKKRTFSFQTRKIFCTSHYSCTSQISGNCFYLQEQGDVFKVPYNVRDRKGQVSITWKILSSTDCSGNDKSLCTCSAGAFSTINVQWGGASQQQWPLHCCSHTESCPGCTPQKHTTNYIKTKTQRGVLLLNGKEVAEVLRTKSLILTKRQKAYRS